MKFSEFKKRIITDNISYENARKLFIRFVNEPTDIETFNLRYKLGKKLIEDEYFINGDLKIEKL